LKKNKSWKAYMHNIKMLLQNCNINTGLDSSAQIA
jgi:hypothetical protein